MSDHSRLCLMAVHAHPDDETILNGGTFLRCVEEGIFGVLVCATAGEEGEIVDPTMDQDAVRPRLAEVRTDELRGAARVLKIDAVEMLGYRDSGMVGTPANENPACFHQADLDEATTRLVRLIRKYRPSVLISYNAYGFYGHPDHIKAHQVTRAAFERAADPTFAPTPNLNPWQPLKLYETTVSREAMEKWREMARQENPDREAEQDDNGIDRERIGTPLDQITTRVDVRRFAEERRQALRCHRTQIPADSFFFRPLPEGFPEDLLGYEEYVRVRSLVEVPEKEDDLFAGLR